MIGEKQPPRQRLCRACGKAGCFLQRKPVGLFIGFAPGKYAERPLGFAGTHELYGGGQGGAGAGAGGNSVKEERFLGRALGIGG